MVQADLLKSSEQGEKKKNKKKIGGRTWLKYETIRLCTLNMFLVVPLGML